MTLEKENEITIGTAQSIALVTLDWGVTQAIDHRMITDLLGAL